MRPSSDQQIEGSSSINKAFEGAASELRELNWFDASAVHRATRQLLDVASGQALSLLVERAVSDPPLVSLSESLKWCDKLVLHDDPSGFRLRIHLFRPEYVDVPHSHRGSFTALILRGGYEHYFWGPEQIVASVGLPATPLAVRDERPGCAYTLAHDELHSFSAEPQTVSMVVRSPALKERSIQFNPVTQTTNWKYGAQMESAEERLAVAFTPDVACRSVGFLQQLGLV